MEELDDALPAHDLVFAFQRQFRTASSEGYIILADGERAGRVDLHFATENVYATIVLEIDFDEREVAQVIEAIDDQLVTTATVRREDLQVYVYRGNEVGFYNDDDFLEADEALDTGEYTPGA